MRVYAGSFIRSQRLCVFLRFNACDRFLSLAKGFIVILKYLASSSVLLKEGPSWSHVPLDVLSWSYL
jgi:hypothetical protein